MAYAELGNATRAMALVNDAEVVSNINVRDRMESLTGVAAGLARNRQDPETALAVQYAVNLAKSIDHGPTQQGALRNLAKAIAQAGNTDKAVELALVTQAPGRALEEIVLLKLSENDSIGAESIASQIPADDALRRGRAYLSVAFQHGSNRDRTAALSALAKVEAAIATLQQRKSLGFARALTLGTAVVHSVWGDMREGFERIRTCASDSASLPEATGRLNTLCQVARAQSLAGDLQGLKDTLRHARAALDEITDADERNEALAILAKTWSRVEEFKDAHAYTLAISGDNNRFDAYFDLIEGLTKAGKSGRNPSARGSTTESWPAGGAVDLRRKTDTRSCPLDEIPDCLRSRNLRGR